MKAFRVPGETSDRDRSIPVIYAVSSAESRDLHMFGETNFFFLYMEIYSGLIAIHMQLDWE